ncbi:MAG: DUF4065 domain-containing protein [Betaproteobacteria bacterium]|nr:MAG: DUF4065 domain-containing protein [Betaproteobacteria bacterium]
MYDARAIANFLLDYADQKKTKVTLLLVLKMIYYAHGWHLSRHGEPLVRQPFEAWTHGPVVRAVWEAFRGNGKWPLTARAKRFDVLAHSYSVVNEPIKPEQAAFLENIFDAYAHVDAFDLSNATHVPGSPWDAVWNAPNGAINVGMKIPNDEIRKWFSGKRAPGFLH